MGLSWQHHKRDKMVAPLVAAAIPMAIGAATTVGSAIAGKDAGKLRLDGSTFYNPTETFYGGHPQGAADVYRYGIGGSDAASGMSQGFWNQARAGQMRSPRAFENQTLSNLEAQSRGMGLGLASSAAHGNQPSEAAMLMRSGMNRAIANQSALSGSARGNSGLAMAQANQGGNVAAMQNQAYTDSAALRAKEMAEARGQYLNAASAQRGMDQNRLQIGNQMAQYNAGLNDQYSLGMGQLGLGASNTAADWYGKAQNPLNQDLQAQQFYEGQSKSAWDNYVQNQLAVAGANAGVEQGFYQGLQRAGGTLAGAGGNMMTEAIKKG